VLIALFKGFHSPAFRGMVGQRANKSVLMHGRNNTSVAFNELMLLFACFKYIWRYARYLYLGDIQLFILELLIAECNTVLQLLASFLPRCACILNSYFKMKVLIASV